MVAIVSNNGGENASTWTPPSGWTLYQALDTSANPKAAVFYKLAGGAEPANYTWSGWTTRLGGASICTYRGVDLTTHWDVTPSVVTATSGTTVTATSITTVTANAELVVCIVANSSSATFTPPASPAWANPEPVDLAAQRAQSQSYVVQAAAGATGTQLWTQSTSAQPRLIMLGALRPAGAGAAASLVHAPRRSQRALLNR